jgi:chromosome segregation ATPase
MEVFVEIVDLIKAAPFNLGVLIVLNILMGAFIAFYAIPELRRRAEQSEKIVALESDVRVKDLAAANQLEKIAELEDDVRVRDKSIVELQSNPGRGVNADHIHEQLAGILDLCKHTNNILAEHIDGIEKEMEGLSDEVKSIQTRLVKLRANNTNSNEKFRDIELELRIMGQQLSNIINRLASVTGILVGSSPALGDLLHGLDDSKRELK